MKSKLSYLTGRDVLWVDNYNLSVGGYVDYVYSSNGVIRGDTYYIDTKESLNYLIGMSE